MAEFDLDSILSVPADKMPMITLTGDPGIGKTSLAALFPAPIFIQVEAGMDAIPEDVRPKSFPVVTSVLPYGDGRVAATDWNNINRQLSAVLNGKHNYKTLVIDSITKLYLMYMEFICESESDSSKRNMAQACGGYNKAYIELGRMMGEIHKKCLEIREKRGMAIVYIAHSDMETYDPPDGDAYTRLVLQMNKHSRPHFVAGVDLLAYMTTDFFVKKQGRDDKKGKAQDTGMRILRCTTNASSDAKNRYDIESDIPVPKGTNPLLNYIPALMQYAPAE